MRLENDEQFLEESRKYYKSEEFQDYAAMFPGPFTRADRRANACVKETVAVGNDKPLSYFKDFWQSLWEELPDSPSIHHPGFYTICDFAEYACFNSPEAPQ
jgi:hypothetical protein